RCRRRQRARRSEPARARRGVSGAVSRPARAAPARAARAPRRPGGRCAGGCPDPARPGRHSDRRGERSLPARPATVPEAGLSIVWIAVLAVGAGTVAIKATGPVLLSGRVLPRGLLGVVELLAPALLAALV